MNLSYLKILPTLSLDTLLITPLCGWLFTCGCTWPWAGLADHCNAFFAASESLHCPWCMQIWVGYLAIGLALAASIFVAVQQQHGHWLYQTFWGVTVFFGAMLAVGWLTVLITHYPSFLGFPVNDRIL